jgi:hypothetical protein
MSKTAADCVRLRQLCSPPLPPLEPHTLTLSPIDCIVYNHEFKRNGLSIWTQKLQPIPKVFFQLFMSATIPEQKMFFEYFVTLGHNLDDLESEKNETRTYLSLMMKNCVDPEIYIRKRCHLMTYLSQNKAGHGELSHHSLDEFVQDLNVVEELMIADLRPWSSSRLQRFTAILRLILKYDYVGQEHTPSDCQSRYVKGFMRACQAAASSPAAPRAIKFWVGKFV